MSKRVSRFLSFLTLSLLITACTPSTPSTSGDQSSSAAMEGSSSSQLIMEPGADGQEDEPQAMEPTDDDDRDAMEGDVNVNLDVSATTSRTITIDASNFTFSPAMISVKKGENVTLRLQGMEGNHGFAVAELGINTPVSQGTTVDVVLPTDKTGTFSFRCSVPCGPGHKEMTGTITITE